MKHIIRNRLKPRLVCILKSSMQKARTESTCISDEIWKKRHQESLQSIHETLNIATQTAEVIAVQSEQLDRTERDVDNIQSSLRTSKRIIRGMSWSGWIYNNLFSAKEQNTISQKNDGLSDSMAMGFICPECKMMFESDIMLTTHYHKNHYSSQVQLPQSPLPESTNDVHQTYLTQLEPCLAELKHASLALQLALDTQNKQLDRLDPKIEAANDGFRQVALLSRSIHRSGLGEGIQLRFRCALQDTVSSMFLQNVQGEPLLSAQVISDECLFLAYSVGADDAWGFQSESSRSYFGVNKFGYLRIQASELRSYEQFVLDITNVKAVMFCPSSYLGLGGWIARRKVNDPRLTVIRGLGENKVNAIPFRIMRVE